MGYTIRKIGINYRYSNVVVLINQVVFPMNSFPSLHLAGTRTEMGRVHGEHFKSLILSLIEARTEVLRSEFPSLTEERLSRTCMYAMEATKKFTPKVYEEVRATAEACGVAEWKMIICGGYTDLLDVFRIGLNSAAVGDHSECTTLVQSAGGTILGTWDSNSTALDSAVLLQRSPIDIDVSSICLTTAGWPAQQGVNSAGVAFAINNLMPTQTNEQGLNYIAANARMAEVGSIDQFVEFARTVDFCAGHAYVMVDDCGRGAVVETTAKRITENWVNDHLVQTNHYISERMIDDNSGYPYLEGSIDRKNEMEALVKARISAENISGLLEQTNVINKADPDGLVMTCAFFVADAVNRTLHIAKGPSSGQGLVSFQL